MTPKELGQQVLDTVAVLEKSGKEAWQLNIPEFQRNRMVNLLDTAKVCASGAANIAWIVDKELT